MILNMFLGFYKMETYHLSLFSLFVLCEGLAHPCIVAKKSIILEILAMAVTLVSTTGNMMEETWCYLWSEVTVVELFSFPF